MCLDFKRNYLLDNLILAVSVSLKTFSNTTGKRVVMLGRFDPSVTGNESYNENTHELT